MRKYDKSTHLVSLKMYSRETIYFMKIILMKRRRLNQFHQLLCLKCKSRLLIHRNRKLNSTGWAPIVESWGLIFRWIFSHWNMYYLKNIFEYNLALNTKLNFKQVESQTMWNSLNMIWLSPQLIYRSRIIHTLIKVSSILNRIVLIILFFREADLETKT